MTIPEPAAALPAALEGQPIERITRDGVEYVVLGTAHVSRASVEAVEALLAHESFDAVAIELCDSRAASVRDPEAFKRMDLFEVIRQGKAGMVAASLVLSSFQRRMASRYGIEPGAEMKAAMQGGHARNLPVWLVDREVGTTLKRAWRSVGFWQRFGLMGGLLASVFDKDEIAEEDIENLKQNDILESAFSDFAKGSQPLYRALIGERDEYMAARLREAAMRAPGVKRVLVVIGAGHLKGLVEQLKSQQQDPATLADDACRRAAVGALAEISCRGPGAGGVRFDRLRLHPQYRRGLCRAAQLDPVHRLPGSGGRFCRRGSPLERTGRVHRCAAQTLPPGDSRRRHQRHDRSLGAQATRGRLRDAGQRCLALEGLVDQPRGADTC